MRNVPLVLLLALLSGCETTQQSKDTIPKQTPTGIAFNTSDLLYTGGLGEAGVDGFCRRMGSQVAEQFAQIGINAVTNAPPTMSQAKITVVLSTIETKGGAGLDIFLGTFGTQKIRVRYSAQLDSPSGTTLATWKHEDEDESIDRLASHIASDIVKYLKKGFR
jgi:hypothetical protein